MLFEPPRIQPDPPCAQEGAGTRILRGSVHRRAPGHVFYDILCTGGCQDTYFTSFCAQEGAGTRKNAYILPAGMHFIRKAREKEPTATARYASLSSEMVAFDPQRPRCT